MHRLQATLAFRVSSVDLTGNGATSPSVDPAKRVSETLRGAYHRVERYGFAAGLDAVRPDAWRATGIQHDHYSRTEIRGFEFHGAKCAPPILSRGRCSDVGVGVRVTNVNTRGSRTLAPRRGVGKTYRVIRVHSESLLGFRIDHVACASTFERAR